MPISEQNKQTVRRIYEEYINRNQVTLLSELFAADYVGPDGARGPAGFASAVDGLRHGFPDIRFRVADLIAEGDRVTIRWSWSGKHTGTFRGFEPSNQKLENTGIAIYQLRDAKVVRSWLETDRLGVLQQMGAAPETPPRAPAAGVTPPSRP